VAHIAEDRIIQIIAEGGELHAAERTHVERCGHCRGMLQELEADLERLRRQAVAAAPAPERRFVLPSDGSAKRPFRAWRWRWAALGTALSAVLLILVLQLGPEERLPGLPPATTPVADWKDPEMIKVNRLAENPLPKAYLALSESLDGVYDEEFIDFLIPPLNDDSLS
jgi:hypothetical protein